MDHNLVHLYSNDTNISYSISITDKEYKESCIERLQACSGHYLCNNSGSGGSYHRDLCVSKLSESQRGIVFFVINSGVLQYTITNIYTKGEVNKVWLIKCG